MLSFILFIVLFIVCLKYLYKYKIFKEGYFEPMKPRDEPTKKGLICYYGGAFRDGGNGTTMHDTENGYDSQYYATQTHLKLTEIIKQKGYDVDTMINTYHSNYEKELSKWYNPFNIILKT